MAHTIQAQDGNVMEQLGEITSGDMPAVVIDATGNQKAINRGVHYLAHGSRYILIGLQKEELIFSRPKYHKRETTLISSRNATRKDFEQVIAWLKNTQIMPGSYINNVVKFSAVKDRFPYWLDPAAGIIITLVGKD